MTDKEIDNVLAVLRAYMKGQKIEFKSPNGEWAEWKDSYGILDFHAHIYRVKPDEPKPHYRPFKSAAEVLAAIKEHGNYIQDGRTYRLLKKFTFAENGKIVYSFSGLQDRIYDSLDFRFVDGTPFGVKED